MHGGFPPSICATCAPSPRPGPIRHFSNGSLKYALRHVDALIGVACYHLLGADALPTTLMDALPTSQELEPGILPSQRADDE